MDQLVSERDVVLRQLEELHRSQWTEVRTHNDQIWKSMEENREIEEQYFNRSISDLNEQVSNVFVTFVFFSFLMIT